MIYFVQAGLDGGAGEVIVNTTIDLEDVISIIMIVLILSLPAAWVTHVAWIIGKLASAAGPTGGQVALGCLGLFIPPVGVIHGYMIWFGAGF